MYVGWTQTNDNTHVNHNEGEFHPEQKNGSQMFYIVVRSIIFAGFGLFMGSVDNKSLDLELRLHLFAVEKENETK